MFLILLTGFLLLKVSLVASECNQGFYTSSSGTVSSPSYSTSSTYANNLYCTYDITVGSGSGIKLTWLSFDIKGKMPNCDDDYVEIFIGCGRHSIGKYCSENGYQPFDVYSRDNCLRIRFKSDGSGAGKGFQATYKSFSSGSPSGVGGSCLSTRTLSSTSGIISSPYWPRDYPSLQDCYWKIEVGRKKSIKIAFMDFDLEYDFGCDDDKVKVKGGDDSDSYDQSSTIRNSACGEKSPFHFTSSKERIWIRFKSDSFRSERGFVAGYVMYESSDSSLGGVVVGILLPLVFVFVCAGCIYYRCVRQRRLARAQQHITVAHVTAPTQQVTINHPPPAPQPGYGPPPSQAGYFPPPQSGYAPPPQPGYAPPPYSQVVGAPYPQQDKSGSYPAAPPGGQPYPPGPLAPYPPGEPAGVPPYPTGQPDGVPPYPAVQTAPGGVAPYPSAPPPATAPPYPPQ
nr:tolloid-like protein 2 isoform X2 [Pocillopora verrucosa]